MPDTIKIPLEGLSEETRKQLGLYKELTEAAKSAQEANKAAMDGLLEFAGKASGLGDVIKGLGGGPVSLAVNGLVLGFRELDKISRTVTDNLSEIAMPDFNLEKVGAAARAWTGLADAITKANEASAGADSVYQRQITALQNQLKVTQELNEEKKRAELANLEAHKDSMSPEDYAAAKSAIENSAADANRAADGKESAAELQAKYNEQFAYQATATQKAKQAAAIKLPENDKDVESQIEVEKDRLAKAKEESQRRQANIEWIGQVSTDSLSEGSSAFADRLKFRETYGLTANARDAEAQERAAKQKADDEVKGIQADIDRRQKALDDRKKLRSEAADAQEKATTIGNELPQARANASTRQIIDTLNTHGGRTNQALGDLAAALGLNEQQRLNLVAQILNHQMTMQEAWERLAQRQEMLARQQENARLNNQ